MSKNVLDMLIWHMPLISRKMIKYNIFNLLPAGFNCTQMKHCFISFIYSFGVLRRCTGHIMTGRRAEETSTYSWSRFCTVNSRPTERNYQFSRARKPNPHLRGGRRECYHSAIAAQMKHCKLYTDWLYTNLGFCFYV